MGIEIAHPPRLGDGERQRLIVIVLEHMMGDIVGHGFEHGVAGFGRDFAAAHRAGKQDLEIDLMVGGVDAGRIVDGVGVDAPALKGIFDAAELGGAEVGALAHHLGAQIAAVDAQGIVERCGHGAGEKLPGGRNAKTERHRQAAHDHDLFDLPRGADAAHGKLAQRPDSIWHIPLRVGRSSQA